MPALNQKPTLLQQIEFISNERKNRQEWISGIHSNLDCAESITQVAQQQIEMLNAIEERLISQADLDSHNLSIDDVTMSFKSFVEKTWLMRHSQKEGGIRGQLESYEQIVDEWLAVLVPILQEQKQEGERVTYENLGVAAIAKPNLSQLEKILGHEGENYQLSN